MTLSRPPAVRRGPALRRAIGPLGAMAVLGLTAGFLIGQDAARAGSPDDAVPTAVPAPTPTARTSTGSGQQRTAGGLRAKGLAVATAQVRYRFLLMQPGGEKPIRWNPCKPVHYKVALGGDVPPSEIRYVRAAFAAAGEALGGTEFVYDGTTSVIPDTVDDSSRAGTDIVFAFAEAVPGDTGSDLLSGWEAGRGGFAAANLPVKATDGASSGVRQVPTHGSVVVDVAKWDVMSRHDRAVLYLHEIGHAIGLDHPKDNRQIMSSGAYDLPAEYQPGDLTGLAHLGRQEGCQ